MWWGMVINTDLLNQEKKGECSKRREVRENEQFIWLFLWGLLGNMFCYCISTSTLVCLSNVRIWIYWVWPNARGYQQIGLLT